MNIKRHLYIYMVSTSVSFLIIILFFFSENISAQNIRLIRSMPVTDCIYIALDHHQNLYTVSKKGEIRKWDGMGKPKEHNNSLSLGRLSDLDVEDPMKILALYPDFNTVFLLDKYLVEQRRLDLNSTGIFQLQGICHSSDDHIWVYDPNDLQLKKLNMNLETKVSSSDLSLSLGYSPDISKIREHGKKLYLLEREKAILIFDTYAQFDKRIPFNGIKDAEVNTDHLYYYKEGLFVYHLKNFQEVSLSKGPIDDFIQLSVKGNRLAVLRKNHLDLYEIKF